MSEEQNSQEQTGGEQTEDVKEYAKDSPADEATDAPSGKEGITEGDETLADDQGAFQPESS